MKTPLTLALLATAMGLAPAAHAAGSPLEKTFTAFARCDASLFTQLHADAETWKAHAPLDTANGISWFVTPDRSRSDNQVAFTGAPTLAGLPVSAYVDNGSDMGTLGQYLFWGWVIDAPLDNAVKQLSPLIEQAQALHPTRGMVVRSEMKLGNLWQPTFNQGGIPSGMKKVERVLMFEEIAGKTQVTCSLQGAVDGTLLTELRPDIPVADHPKAPTTLRIEDVPLADGVLEGLDVPLLAPRFTSLTYSYRTSDEKPDVVPTTFRIEADNGLLNVTEDYGFFSVQRVEKAGLIQFKSKMSRGPERVLQTRTVKHELPGSWAPGGVLRTETTMVFVPEGRSDKVSKVTMSCTVGDRYPASQVHASLRGDAIALTCRRDKSTETKAFIEDLGVVLPVDHGSGRKRTQVTLIDLDVVR